MGVRAIRKKMLIWTLAAWLVPSAVAAQSIHIVFNEIPADLKITESMEPSAVFMRRAVEGTLLNMSSEEKPAVPRLDLADSLSVLNRGREIVLGFRKGASFSSGRPATDEDIAYSLQLCRNTGWLKEIEKFSVQVDERGSEDAISINFVLTEASTTESALLSVADCPIYEAKSTRLFGDAFGKGTNIVSTGTFVISSFASAHSYQLMRSPSSAPNGEGPQEIVLTASGDASRALSSLRAGDADILFLTNQDGEVLQKAGGDESLVVSQCGINKLVYRRRLEVICENGSVRASDIHYHR